MPAPMIAPTENDVSLMTILTGCAHHDERKSLTVGDGALGGRTKLPLHGRVFWDADPYGYILS